jgi:predicted nucleotide-binding protein
LYRLDFESSSNDDKEELICLIETAIIEYEICMHTRRISAPTVSRGIVDVNKTQGDPQMRTNKVFVVHGRNNEIKLDVARTLTTLDIEPIILHEQADKGKTIIEKFNEYSDVSFAVVILSSDDKGCLSGEYPNKIKDRARQNVIFELGYFIGKLGRNKVFSLSQSKDLEIPSDYTGVLFTSYDSSGAWRYKLVKELKAASFNVDANKII